MTDFWDVAPRSLVEFGRLFRGACCLQEAVSTSEKSVNFYQRVWRNIPKVTYKTLNSLTILNHDHFHCAQRVAVSNVTNVVNVMRFTSLKLTHVIIFSLLQLSHNFQHVKLPLTIILEFIFCSIVYFNV
jgi:hypothetical protein